MDLPGFSKKNMRHLVGFELQINSEGLFSVNMSEIQTYLRILCFISHP